MWHDNKRKRISNLIDFSSFSFLFFSFFSSLPFAVVRTLKFPFNLAHILKWVYTFISWSNQNKIQNIQDTRIIRNRWHISSSILVILLPNFAILKSSFRLFYPFLGCCWNVVCLKDYDERSVCYACISLQVRELLLVLLLLSLLLEAIIVSCVLLVSILPFIPLLISFRKCYRCRFRCVVLLLLLLLALSTMSIFYFP